MDDYSDAKEAVARHDDFPQLTRPDHVNEEAWQTYLSDYHTALAQYESAVAATNNQVRQGLWPTTDDQEAERVAHNSLEIARGVLLDLYHHPNGRH